MATLGLVVLALPQHCDVDRTDLEGAIGTGLHRQRAVATLVHSVQSVAMRDQRSLNFTVNSLQINNYSYGLSQ